MSEVTRLSYDFFVSCSSLIELMSLELDVLDYSSFVRSGTRKSADCFLVVYIIVSYCLASISDFIIVLASHGKSCKMKRLSHEQELKGKVSSLP